jgi:hypothetical protein
MYTFKFPTIISAGATVASIAVGGVMLFSGAANALPQWCIDIGGPPCTGGPPVVEEGGSNNLSFPAIMSDNVAPNDFAPTYPAVEFAPITDEAECTTGVPDGSAVPENILCYYDGKVWWLQQRAANKWQAYPPEDPDPSTPVDVSAVDVGDLLESSRSIKAKQIRTEFTLLMDATSDPDFAGGVLDPFDSDLDANPNTFQAFGMSGAVPGTDQSINEIQGTDYGPVAAPGQLGGTRAMVDPTTVKLTDEGIPVHATVYSRCARLVIQKITDFDNLAWSSDVDDGNGRGGYWVGGALPPVVNVAAWDGSYSAEINASGTLIYGYNWNTKLIDQAEKSGDYRLTFVLEGGPTGDPATSGRCAVNLNTVFDSTEVVNLGDVHPGEVLTAADLVGEGAHHGEGGAVFVDVVLGAGGGGGGGGGNPNR